MTEHPLTLRVSLQEIWRHRLLISIVGVLCALAGTLYGAFRPSEPTAAALVLLPPSPASPSSTPTRDVHTDKVIARSTPVLAAAGARVSPPIGAAALKKLSTVTALSGQVLQIQVHTAPSSYATSLANALVESYTKYLNQLNMSTSETGVAALQKESALLTQQIQGLQNQISTLSARIASEGAASPAGQVDNTLLGSLRNEQNQVGLQQNSVNSQIVTAELSNGAANSTAQILQQAAIVPASNNAPVEGALIGLGIGLVGSGAFVLIRRERDHRLRLRDEIARAAGAPVIASLEAPRCTTASAWHEFLGKPQRASTEWALRHVLHSLLNRDGDERRTAVRVISFSGDLPALAVGPLLALYAAASGTPTALLPEDHQSLISLRSAFTGSEPVGRELPFTIGLNDIGNVPPQLLVALVVFNDTPTPANRTDGVNLLAISPGFVTADQIAQLALETTDAGETLDCVVLVNADPTDATAGVITDNTRVLSPHVQSDSGGNGLVPFGPRTSKSIASAERVSSREG